MCRSRPLLLVAGFAACVFVTAVSAVAQEIDESDVQAWFQYEFQYRLREKLRASWDLGYRELVSTEDTLGDWSRIHTRGMLLYVHSKRVTFEGGIGGYYTFAENLADQLELRAWQGAIVF